MAEESRGIRLCVSVAESPDPPRLSAVKGSCVQCEQPVWVDSAQELPAEARERGVDPMCENCALADPVIALAIITSLPDVFKTWSETGVIPGIEINDGK
jgi:hypothetical protein